MWVRGLKLVVRHAERHLSVAPYVGAWIETKIAKPSTEPSMSHPMWVRGLKPRATIPSISTMGGAHPMWVRGLEHDHAEDRCE